MLKDDISIDLVVVKHQDFYFRALILGGNDDGYEIFAFDIGFICTVKKSQMYRLLDIFSVQNYPPFIHCCRIHGLVPLKENWSSIAM